MVVRWSQLFYVSGVSRRNFIERLNSEILQAFVELEGALNSCIKPSKTRP